MDNSTKSVMNMMRKFNVTVVANDKLPTTITILEKDYQSTWLKIDSLGLKIIKIVEVTT
mgnify:CR=1 FL=1